MRNSKGFSLLLPIFVIIGIVLFSVAAIYVVKKNPGAFFPAKQQGVSGSENSEGENSEEGKSDVGKFLNLVEQKIKSIITPNPPISNNLTPVRDLRGTWKSSLSGKGLQLYGKLATGPGTTKIYEDGDMELIIDSVTNNVASGKVRYTNLCVTVQTTAPKINPVNVKNCTKDSGYLPMAIEVSGTRLNFGAVSAAGATFNMQGTYTTDLISGSMTTNLPPYGVLKGEFHLMRVQN